VTISGSAVNVVSADIRFAPDQWDANWAVASDPNISVQITNIEGHTVTDVNPSTIRLNGSAQIVPESAILDASNVVLTVEFYGAEAVNSLGTPAPGAVYYPTVQGGFSNSPDIFSGKSRVEILKAIEVEIDIKPGSFPNSINLGSKGTVPVAIFSSADFDAAIVDPETVTLAGAGVKIKGKGTPMASLEDVNGDGLPDLVVHVLTQALELTEGDEVAVLEGKTFNGTPIIGKDLIRVVP
jgi:hypothetical protein